MLGGHAQLQLAEKLVTVIAAEASLPSSDHCLGSAGYPWSQWMA